MKKLVSFLVLFVMLATVATAVNATTSNTLSDELYAMGKKYGMTAEHKVKIDRYLADNEVTDEQANEIVAKAEAAIQVMKDAGTTSYSKLTADQKEQIKTIAIEAAAFQIKE